MQAQNKLTPEQLWQLGRVSAETMTDSGEVIYGVTRYDIEANKGERNLFSVPAGGGESRQLTTSVGTEGGVQALPDGRLGYEYKGQWWEMNADGSDAAQKTHEAGEMSNIRLSPDGGHILFSRKVKVEKVFGKDFYPAYPKSNVQIYTDLMYRHWDTWKTGECSHVFYADYKDGQLENVVDIMKDEPYDCPQQPYGGAEDIIWSRDGKSILYVCKKKTGKEYAVSTNTDIYQYDLASGQTSNLTEDMMGYDTQPAYNKEGNRLAWTGMKTDGYESDKNDLWVMDTQNHYKLNLTAAWDGTVSSFLWSDDGKSLYFTAPVEGTIQLFEVQVPANLMARILPVVKQLTQGDFDISGIVGQKGHQLVVSREDMNHATELYTVDLAAGGQMTALTTVNKDFYDQLSLSRTEKRWVKTTDGQKELVWVIYPPDFDPHKKYPTLLYCQGGPQAALSQFYSFRWNFQLIAANGYIVVAPNRRGMPGYGVKWNKEISKDWGGQPMQDYLSAIDAMAKEPYVDASRLGCVGASYGGYSVYMLAGIHHGRFKTFVAHDGLFDLKSWYGTTEEMWFANYDIGGPYWDPKNTAAQKSYQKFSPSNYVANWNTPIMIIQGGVDFRVPVEQGLQAFQAAQLQGVKSKLLYFPEENHWVLKCQDALVWQHAFFDWLEETLKQ